MKNRYLGGGAVNFTPMAHDSFAHFAFSDGKSLSHRLQKQDIQSWT